MNFSQLSGNEHRVRSAQSYSRNTSVVCTYMKILPILACLCQINGFALQKINSQFVAYSQ